MTPQQLTALDHHCRLAGEVVHPRFIRRGAFGSIVLTVNSGYE